MKVLLIPSSYPDRASPVRGIFYKEQAQALIRYGIDAAVMHPRLQGLRSLRPNNVGDLLGRVTSDLEDGVPTLCVRGFAWPRVDRRKQLITRAQTLLKAYIEQYGRPDLIHAHCSLWGGCAAREIKLKYAIPYVVTEHSSLYAQQNLSVADGRDTERTIADADAFIVVSRHLQGLLQRYSQHKQLTIVPNLVDSGFFTLPEIAGSDKTFRFLVLAALTPNKGVEVAVRAFAAAFSGRPEVRLEIGGDGEQREYLMRLVESLSIGRQVRFLGLLSRQEVRAAMWRANCLVLSSYFETFGMVLIEALSTVLPVLASACGGPQDIVRKCAGELVEPGSEPQFRDAMIRIWQRRRPRVCDASRQLRRYAIAHFGEERVVAKIDAIYRSVMQAT